jgi:sugar phosphate permease
MGGHAKFHPGPGREANRPPRLAKRIRSRPTVRTPPAMSTASSLPSAAARPTRVRHRVVGLVILLGMVTYIDRVCISNLAPHIMADLGLDKVQMGYVFSAFAFAYALFELPTGWMADRSGTRRVFTRIVAR